jgi:CRISPR-associated protein Cmr4
MYENTLYLIENHTNMHVGSGDANFGTVDRLIQRDAVTGYPTIHASSLKGALKEYCEARHDEKEAPTFIAQTFGDEDHAGNVRFLDAWIMAIPFRSDTQPYFACTSPKAIAHLLEMCELTGISLPEKVALQKAANYRGEEIAIAKGKAVIEEFEAKNQDFIDFTALERYTGAPAALIPDKLFTEMLKDLPVIARNQLENGESKNLWYEEVLPRKSRLFTILSTPTYLNESDKSSLKTISTVSKIISPTVRPSRSAPTLPSVTASAASRRWLMRKRIEAYIPKAIDAVRNCNIANERNEVPKQFNGYISSFAASVRQAGLLPTVLFFTSTTERSEEPREKVVEALNEIIGKPLVTQNGKVTDGITRDQVDDACTALKLAIRTFKLVNKDAS